ncbi:MAG: hypothetical protein EP332_09705 [Bacteroidetes bacterium]|nr:MAG: hypothetical protein EP332_09705 [Bacteroidota bacterium]
MMKQIQRLGLIVILIHFSCKSTSPVITAQTNLEKSSMMNGTTELDVWINKSLIAGIPLRANDSLSIILANSGMMQDTARVIRRDLNLPSPAMHFSFYRKTDGKAFSQDHSPELLRLRTAYHDNFGPGLYTEEGMVSGALSNILMVEFERGTPEARIKEILNAHNAVKFFRWRGRVYHVEFDKGIGYDILKKAKKLFAFEEIQSVEHRTKVINSHTR